MVRVRLTPTPVRFSAKRQRTVPWVAQKLGMEMIENARNNMDVSRNRGQTPKMDGLFHGKLY